MKKSPSPLMHRTLLALAVGLCLTALGVVGAGDVLTRPAARLVGDAPSDLNALPVRVPTSSSESISGWFAHGKPGFGAVLLLHGVRGDRREMLERARFLLGAGYSVFLVDLPAHGESTGSRITFGLKEADGVAAALGYLRQNLPGERIGVIGVSLGAASLVLSKLAPAPSAVVLESMYPTIAEAVADRLVRRLGPMGGNLAPLLLWQLPLRLGVTTEQLRPIDRISSLGAPVLIASGTNDQHTTFAETQRIFQATREPKELWAVEGAAHVDLHAYDPKAYESRILAFLSRHLRDGAKPPPAAGRAGTLPRC